MGSKRILLLSEARTLLGFCGHEKGSKPAVGTTLVDFRPVVCLVIELSGLAMSVARTLVCPLVESDFKKLNIPKKSTRFRVKRNNE